MASSCQHLHIYIFCNQWKLSTKNSPFGFYTPLWLGAGPALGSPVTFRRGRTWWQSPRYMGWCLVYGCWKGASGDPQCHDARAQRWAAVPCWPQLWCCPRVCGALDLWPFTDAWTHCRVGTLPWSQMAIRHGGKSKVRPLFSDEYCLWRSLTPWALHSEPQLYRHCFCPQLDCAAWWSVRLQTSVAFPFPLPHILI